MIIGNTKVDTPTSRVKIKDVQAGDTLLTIDSKVGGLVETKVKKTFKREVPIDDVVCVNISGHREFCTKEHPFFVKDKGFVEGEDYRQVAFIHDEIQVLVKKGIEDEVGKIAVESISMAGNLLNLKVPLTGEYNFGSNWAETH